MGDKLTNDHLARALHYLRAQEECRPATPCYLPPRLYDRAEMEGYDMRGFVRQEPTPRR